MGDGETKLYKAEVDGGCLGFLASTFTPIENLSQYKDTDTTIDMLLIVLQTVPARQIMTYNGATAVRELIVVDRGLQPVLLTLWDHFFTAEAAEIASIVEQLPIIVVNRLKVSTYDGIGLSSRGAGSFFINPATESVVALRAWVFDNLSVLTELLSSSELQSQARAFGKNLPNEITTIADVRVRAHTKLFYVRCRIVLSNLEQNMARQYCNSCNKATAAEVGQTYTCNFCRKKDVISVAGVHLEVVASDGTGELSATLYDQDVSTLFNCNYGDLLRNLS